VQFFAVIFDVRELSSRTKKFLEENMWSDGEGEFSEFWLSKTEILDSLDGDCTDIPEDFWERSCFTREQRKALEDVWRRDPRIEARWESA